MDTRKLQGFGWRVFDDVMPGTRKTIQILKDMRGIFFEKIIPNGGIMMVEIYNDVSSVEELIEKYNDVEIFLYGAGASCKLLLMSFWKDVLKGHVRCIIDAKEELSGTTITIDQDEIEIKSIKLAFKDYGKNKDIVLLLTPVFSSKIIAYLDSVEKLDGAKAYLLPMLCRKYEPKEYAIKSENTSMIPKIIHYFWVGKNSMPEEYKNNISGWRRLNPDYEIRCWNEGTYNFQSIAYMKEACQLGSEYFMFATDYARMDVLYRHGGIYLDTDVTLLKPLDELLYNKAFIGIGDNSQVNSGSAIGAIKRHPMIHRFMKCYEDIRFIDEFGRPKINYNTYYETKCLIEHGYKMVNEYQRVCGLTCFPMDVFMPICFAGMEDCYSKKTISEHKINPEESEVYRKAYKSWKNRIMPYPESLQS